LSLPETTEVPWVEISRQLLHAPGMDAQVPRSTRRCESGRCSSSSMAQTSLSTSGLTFSMESSTAVEMTIDQSFPKVKK